MKIHGYFNAYTGYNSLKMNNNAKTTKHPKSNLTDTLELSAVGKHKSGLPNDVINIIREFAKKDAKIGDYMSDEYNNFQRTYLQRHISPNRSALMAKASPLVPNSKDAINSFLRYYGLIDVDLMEIFLGSERYSASRKMNYVSVKDKHGVEILSWSQNAGWLSHPSPEEEAFWDMETAIYAEAFSEARAEMRANGEL